MGIAQELYCKVYIDTDWDKDRLTDLIARISKGTVSRRTVVSVDYEGDVLHNEDFDSAKITGENDEFLFYRYYLDVFPGGHASRGQYIKSIGNLLEELWRSGCKAVAACSFESELPRKGGISNQA
jgi:hypothetical protein